MIWWSLKHNKTRSCQASLEEVLLTSPGPKSTASYTLKWSPVFFTETHEEKAWSGTATQPGLWRASWDSWLIKLWPSPEDAGTDHRHQVPSSGSTAGASS